MIAKYFPAQPLFPGETCTCSMVVAHSLGDIYRDRVLALYDAVYEPSEERRPWEVLCNTGEEYEALKAAVLADYPACKFVD